jgi:hypothetical protein
VSPASGTETPTPTPTERGGTWLVILRAADDPAGVRDDARTFSDVLGGAIQVAPGSCFDPIPDRFGGDRYILGAIGGSKGDVDALAAATQVSPLFEGEVQVICSD